MFEWLPVLWQVITVNSTTPCFLNETVGIDIFKNCGFGNDYLNGILSGWQWVTGGWFSMVLVAILVAFSYIKYHKAIYPLMVGTLFLPIAYFLFPSPFTTFAVLLSGVLIGIFIWYTFISQTNELG